MFNICCTCLKDINKLQAVYLDKTEDAVKQMKHILPEITLDPEIPVYMCSTCHTKLHSVSIFKKQCLENYCRFTKILQESGNAKNQSFNILQTYIKNIKEENQIYVDITNEALKDVNNQINFMTVQNITEKEDTITLVLDETFSPGLNKNINEGSNMTDEIKSSECEEQQEQTNIFIEDNICIEEDIIKFEDSEESNIYQELLSDIKKESDNEQVINENETTDSNAKKGVLKRHIKIHAGIKNFECSICEKTFTQNVNLKRHMTTHTGVKNYKCSVCEKTFTQNVNLKCHIKIHTGVKNYKCSICEKKFIYKCNLNVHMKTHTGVKDYKCSICEKTFTQNVNLKCHIKIHTGVKNYKCSICEKKFIYKCNLNVHMKTHTGVKDYKCSICEKTFTQNVNLKRHLKTHTGEKDFECSICEKKFSQKVTLIIHMKTHTGVKNFECNNCNKKFVKKGNLTNHLKLRLLKKCN